MRLFKKDGRRFNYYMRICSGGVILLDSIDISSMKLFVGFTESLGLKMKHPFLLSRPSDSGGNVVSTTVQLFGIGFQFDLTHLACKKPGKSRKCPESLLNQRLRFRNHPHSMA